MKFHDSALFYFIWSVNNSPVTQLHVRAFIRCLSWQTTSPWAVPQRSARRLFLNTQFLNPWRFLSSLDNVIRIHSTQEISISSFDQWCNDRTTSQRHRLSYILTLSNKWQFHRSFGRRRRAVRLFQRSIDIRQFRHQRSRTTVNRVSLIISPPSQTTTLGEISVTRGNLLLWNAPGLCH